MELGNGVGSGFVWSFAPNGLTSSQLDPSCCKKRSVPVNLPVTLIAAREILISKIAGKTPTAAANAKIFMGGMMSIPLEIVMISLTIPILIKTTNRVPVAFHICC
jgi:hypothetical protein